MDIPIGRVRHVLNIPGIDLEGYAAVAERMARSPRSGRRWVASALAGLAGAGVGLWLAWAEVRATMTLGVEGGTPAVLGGRAILLWAAGLVAAAAAATAAAFTLHAARALARLHARAPGVMGPHELLFGEDALLCRNARRAVALPWTSLTGAERVGDRLFLIFNGMEALWLPDATLAEVSDRAAFDAFLNARLAAGPAL